jgi:hypothetical protein
MGITVGRNGKVSGYGSYSASRTLYTPQQEAAMKDYETKVAQQKQAQKEAQMMNPKAKVDNTDTTTVNDSTTDEMKAEADLKIKAQELRDQTKTYILGLKDKGLSETTVNGYISKLDSLSDDQILANADKFSFTDQNQRNNQTIVDGKNQGDIMCYPTSVAGALSALGVQNPMAALGMQYEDFLDDLMRNDSNISKLANGTGFRPRETIDAEKAMLNKYFGDQVSANSYDGWDGKNYNQMISRFKGIEQKYLDKDIEVVMGTKLTHGGHVVRLVDVSDDGIYITDSWGNSRPGNTAVYKSIFGFQTKTIDHYNYSVNYQKNTPAMESTYGENNFIPWGNVQSQNVGKLWYMTIEKK